MTHPAVGHMLRARRMANMLSGSASLHVLARNAREPLCFGILTGSVGSWGSMISPPKSSGPHRASHVRAVRRAPRAAAFYDPEGFCWVFLNPQSSIERATQAPYGDRRAVRRAPRVARCMGS